MSLIKTFKLRNKLEIDVFVNNELFLTITRPFSSNKNETSDIIHFDLLDGYAEMYPNENQLNSFIYFTSSGGNQMALVLTANEAHELLELTDTYDSDYEPDTESESDTTDTDSTPTPSIELEACFEEKCETESETQLKGETESETQLKGDLVDCCKDSVSVSGELQTKYIKVIVLDRQHHPKDNNFYIYMIDIKQDIPFTCVSEEFYEKGDFVNVDCYSTHWGVKGILSSGVLSEYKQEPEIEEINSRFASWFGF